MSLRTSAHTGAAIRIPAEKPGKSVVLRANSQCFSYLPKVFLFVLWYCKEYGLPRRFAPRNDMQKHGRRPPRQLRSAMAIRVPCPGCPLRKRPYKRSHAPAFCMSLRTSAHTGAAIRIPAGKLDKLALLRANSYTLFRVCLKYCFLSCPTAESTDCRVASRLAMTCRNLPRVRVCKDALPGKPVTAYVFAQGAACFLLPLRGCGLPRRFAPRNDMLKLAACPHRQLCPPGANCYALRIRPKYCFLSCPAAGERIATSLRSSQ